MTLSRSDWYGIAFLTFIGLGIVGFGAAEIGILVHGKAVKTSSASICPEIAESTLQGGSTNITYYELKKSITSLWNWQYADPLGDHSIRMEHACPSVEHDVLMYIDGGLAARTNGKMFSTTSVIEVFDCHNQQIYTITTGSFWITLLNLNRIAVSFHLQDMTGKTLLYVPGTDFMVMSSYSFMDMNGTEIVYAQKDIRTFPWTWKVNIRHPESPVLDVRALNLIFAHASFSQVISLNSKGDQTYTTDWCNSFFVIAGIVDLCVLGVFVVIMIWVCWNYIKWIFVWCRQIQCSRTQCSGCWRACYSRCRTQCSTCFDSHRCYTYDGNDIVEGHPNYPDRNRVDSEPARFGVIITYDHRELSKEPLPQEIADL
jgi:hypothetical protein